MARVRVARITGATPPRVRVARVTGAGAIISASRARVARVTGAGAVRAIVDAPSLLTIGPGEQVSVTATLLYGLTADSWAWRRISGPQVTLAGTGATRTLIGPMSEMAQGVTRIGVSAVVGSQTSAEFEIQVTVLPQTLFSMAPGPTLVWVGASVAPA